MTWTAYGQGHITFFVFTLLCCKYICDIYLSMLDFNDLCSSTTYLLTRLHMQVYIIIMEGK